MFLEVRELVDRPRETISMFLLVVSVMLSAAYVVVSVSGQPPRKDVVVVNDHKKPLHDRRIVKVIKWLWERD